jgi:hypothetical protein
VNRGRRDDAHEKHPDIAVLIEQAEALVPKELPGDQWQAIAFIRRLARVTLDLAEHLEEIGTVKGLVEC